MDHNNDEYHRDAHVYHLGLFREKVSLQPVECECISFIVTLVHLTCEPSTLDYSKLPSEITVDTVFLLDPLIATGGTACVC